MKTRIPDAPPPILPLAKHTVKPLWSVMIPNFNNIHLLKHALESVLCQDPGSEKMQIEVVDDCSTDGDVRELVERVGKGRVLFYRQETNLGSLRNFETCINRAKGEWIHLLHGDDKLKAGFYHEIERLFSQFPEAGAAFTNYAYIDIKGRILKQTAAYSQYPCILPDWFKTISQENKIQTPAIVVKRSVYEQVGSFFAVQFGEDWEMWVRIASQFSFAYSPKSLAQYRIHKNNITSKSFLSGQNILDLKKVITIIQNYVEEDKKAELKLIAEEKASKYIASTPIRVLKDFHNPGAATVQIKAALKMNLNKHTIFYSSFAFPLCILFYIKFKCYLVIKYIMQKNYRTKARAFFERIMVQLKFVLG